MFTACSWRSSGGLGRLVRVRTFLPTKHGIVRFVAAAGRCYSRHSLNEKEYPSPTGQSKHSGLSGIHLSPHQIPHIHLIANPHDVLISDVQHETLETTIATELGITYLSKVSKEIQRKVFREAYRYLYGPNDRAIIPLPVISGNTALWVFFVIDSGAPNTHISPQACAALGLREDMPSWHVLIGGYKTKASLPPPGPRFRGINILGTNFCIDHRVVKASDYVRGEVKFGFGGEWEAIEERL